MQWSKENKYDTQINISENIVNRGFSVNEKLSTISNKSLSDTFGYTVLFLNSLGVIKMEIENHDVKRIHTENENDMTICDGNNIGLKIWWFRNV